MSTTHRFDNPFRPGAGHMPPYLAGRQDESKEFHRLLTQSVVLDNMVLTGLRGTGKTVLLETFKPEAISQGWLWVGTDLSESATVTEETIAVRLLTDLSTITDNIALGTREVRKVGFGERGETVSRRLDYSTLFTLYQRAPGLPLDKLKYVLELVWSNMGGHRKKGIVFAYDEAQNLADHAEKEQYPLSLILDLFQSLQRKNMPFMLVLAGLPTLFPKLVEARTFAERMFRVVFLDRLSPQESRQAIMKPIEDANCPVKLTRESVQKIVDLSAGYPYFIQYICRDVYDSFIQGQKSVPEQSIVRKLDTDFFAGRWARATDRQRELLSVIASLDNCDQEFTVQEVVDRSKASLEKPFSSSHINQMLSTLSTAGLVYKNRHGKYSFAVPMLGSFIRRQVQDG